MNQLPTGLYQPGTSLLHRLNALSKLLCLLIVMVAIVCTNTIPGYAVLAVITGALVAISGIKPAVALHSAARLRWFFIIILLMNLCFYEPEHPWVQWWIFRPSYEGLMQGINVVVRVFLLLVLSNVLTITTAPLSMTTAIERFISPLHFIGVPTELVAMILSVAIQFIPTLLEETDNIRKAQTARGARFDSRSLIDKARSVLPLVIPVFLAAFKRADELSLAMEARGYRVEAKRQVKQKDPFKTADWLALLLCAALAAIYIVIK